MKLHQYFRSSASYRVRIALNLKNLGYESVPVNLLTGEQLSDDYTRTHPSRLVPLLEHEGETLAQSLAIIEYLEERFPDPPLLPRSPADRAWVRQLALAIACDIHPLNNLRVLQYITGPLGHDDATKTAWARHWIALGFASIETQLARSPRRGRFCFGDAPTLADVCLVPQIANAQRVDLDLAPYPTLRAIERECAVLEPFQRAHPTAQVEAKR